MEGAQGRAWHRTQLRSRATSIRIQYGELQSCDREREGALGRKGSGEILAV